MKKLTKAVVFTASNIQSVSGKSLNTYTGTVAVEDNVAPVLVSARVLDNKTIELTYSENVELTGANDNVFEVGDDFIITNGTTALALEAVELKANAVSGVDNKLTISIEKGSENNTTTLDLTKNITVETKASTKVVDKATPANTQKAGVKVTASK